MNCVQYTIRGVPSYLDADLRGYAKQKEKSLNSILVELLECGLNRFRQQPKNSELMDLAGTWVGDSESDKTFSEMRTIDEDLWK